MDTRPVGGRTTVGSDDHQLAGHFGAQPNRSERLQPLRVAGRAVAEALAQRLEHVTGDPLTTMPGRRMHDNHPVAEIVPAVDRRRAVHSQRRVGDLNGSGHAASPSSPPACSSSTARATDSVNTVAFCSRESVSALWVKLAHSRKQPCA